MIDAYAKQSVAWERVTATDKYGTDTLATTTIACRVVERTRVVRGFDGREAVSGVTLMINKADKPTRSDRFTIDGVQHAVAAIEEIRDFALRGYRVFLA